VLTQDKMKPRGGNNNVEELKKEGKGNFLFKKKKCRFFVRKFFKGDEPFFRRKAGK